jgi:hypothetical protein
MGIGEWISENWINIVTTVSGIGGLWAAVFALRKDAKARKEEAKARRVGNLLTITANHRELWKLPFLYPTLARVIDPAADVAKQPLTPAEEFFMSMAVSHTSSTYEALKDELLTHQEGLRRDVKSFFSLPVPKAVWNKTKLLQNQDFAAFIDSSLK